MHGSHLSCLSWEPFLTRSACMWRQHYKLLIHPQFYMKLADRIYELPTQEVLRRHTVDDIKPHRTVSEHLFE